MIELGRADRAVGPRQIDQRRQPVHLEIRQVVGAGYHPEGNRPALHGPPRQIGRKTPVGLKLPAQPLKQHLLRHAARVGEQLAGDPLFHRSDQNRAFAPVALAAGVRQQRPATPGVPAQPKAETTNQLRQLQAGIVSEQSEYPKGP